MLMKMLRSFLFSSLMIAGFILWPFGEAGALIVKVATVYPEGAPGYAQLQNSLADIQKRTRGDVIMKLYGGGVAGDEADVLRKMRVGRIDMSQFSGVGMGMIFPQIRVIESPGLFQSYEEADHVQDGLFDYFYPLLEEQGFILLGLAEAGFIYLFSKQDLAAPNGLEGPRMWTWKGDPVSGTTMEMFGFRVTPLHISDVNVGLQTGMIDSFYAFPLAATSFQWYSSVQYMLDYKVTRAMACYLMTKKAFLEVSKEEHRAIIREVFKSFAIETNRITRQANEESVAIMKKSGIRILQPPPVLVEKFESASAKVVDEMIQRGVFTRKIYGDIANMVDASRKNRASGGAVPDRQ